MTLDTIDGHVKTYILTGRGRTYIENPSIGSRITALTEHEHQAMLYIGSVASKHTASTYSFEFKAPDLIGHVDVEDPWNLLDGLVTKGLLRGVWKYRARNMG